MHVSPVFLRASVAEAATATGFLPQATIAARRRGIRPPPLGGTTVPSPSIADCAGQGGVSYPDLRKDEFLIDFDIMVKF